jgi:hypothetical protein
MFQTWEENAKATVMFTSGANQLQYRPGTARSRWKVLERFGKGKERMDFKFVKRKERNVLENEFEENTGERAARRKPE